MIVVDHFGWHTHILSHSFHRNRRQLLEDEESLYTLVRQEQIVKRQKKSTFFVDFGVFWEPPFACRLVTVVDRWQEKDEHTPIWRKVTLGVEGKKNMENHVLEVLVSRGFRTVLHLSKQWKESISWRFSGSNVHILGESVTKSLKREREFISSRIKKGEGQGKENCRAKSMMS